MLDIPVWEVSLTVYGPITVEKMLRFSELKGFQFHDPFYSDIKIQRNHSASGVEATVTAYAPTEQLAREAAILFFGQMLDALAIKINQPLYLNYSERQNINNAAHKTLRRVRQEEWREAFKEARLLASTETTFLRALGWYRKGLYTEDPFDKFLAYWNAIEIVASKYHPQVPEGRRDASKNYIWASFIDLWGDCKDWKIIQGQTEWIDYNYEVRNTIAHGMHPIEIETVKRVAQRIDTIERVARKFLLEWREQKLNPQVPPELSEILNCAES